MRELHMRRTNRVIPTYTGDVSGACSALYELGGMVVIHDPSGCNSTYNTHDETRWYDQDSLIFITGLVERDAILGNDEKLVRDVVDAARELRPRFVALCNSPIPFINGTDFRAICKLVERQTGIPCFYVRTNGMHDYVKGAGNAFVAFAERFVQPQPVRARTVNILGATPLDLGIAGSDKSLRTFCADAGFEVISCWAMGSTADELAHAAAAEVNLVVSSTGLAVAQLLHERFGTPYVAGFPVGAQRGVDGPSRFAQQLAEALAAARQTKQCSWPCRDMRATSDGACFAIGEPVLMGSIASAMALEGVEAPQVICPLEAESELLAPGDLMTEGEEDAEAALASAKLVVADELYQPIVPAGAALARMGEHDTPLPHQAFSGRNGWKTAVDLTTLDVRKIHP